MDYYKVLGITEQAGEEQIKQAYRRLAKQYHPDLNPDNPQAEAKFKDIVEAYEILGDAGKRRTYDVKRKKFTEADNGYVPQKGHAAKQSGSCNRKNPLDVTEMFEAFMRMT